MIFIANRNQPMLPAPDKPFSNAAANILARTTPPASVNTRRINPVFPSSLIIR
jgi:hypothetical protein